MKYIIIALVLMGLSACGKKSQEGSKIPPQRDEVQNANFESEYLTLLNNYRTSLGLSKLKYVSAIESVAGEHSLDMAMKLKPFGHWGFKTRCRDLSNDLHARACGEVIAKGQKTPKEVFWAWINSPTHRDSLESRYFTHTGLGIRTDKNGVIYWTQFFLEIR